MTWATLKLNVLSAKFAGFDGSSTCTVSVTGPRSASAGVPLSMPVDGSMVSHPLFVPPVMLHTAAALPPDLASCAWYG